MHVEIQRLQGRLSPQGVAVAHEDIGPEGEDRELGEHVDPSGQVGRDGRAEARIVVLMGEMRRFARGDGVGVRTGTLRRPD